MPVQLGFVLIWMTILNKDQLDCPEIDALYDISKYHVQKKQQTQYPNAVARVLP